MKRGDLQQFVRKSPPLPPLEHLERGRGTVEAGLRKTLRLNLWQVVPRTRTRGIEQGGTASDHPNTEPRVRPQARPQVLRAGPQAGPPRAGPLGL